MSKQPVVTTRMVYDELLREVARLEARIAVVPESARDELRDRLARTKKAVRHSQKRVLQDGDRAYITATNGYAEPLVINCEQFANAIRPTIERLDDEAAGGSGTRENWMALAGGTMVASLDDPTLGRRLRSILAGQMRYVSLRIAERLLINLGLEHYLQDGTLTVVPNPTWSRERWEAYMRVCGVDDPDEVL